jgi:hypothetical protein
MCLIGGLGDTAVVTVIKPLSESRPHQSVIPTGWGVSREVDREGTDKTPRRGGFHSVRDPITAI